MEESGMTDKQFTCFLIFLNDDLNDALEAADMEEKNKKLKRIIDNIRKTIED